jgi:hypothetical protein
MFIQTTKEIYEFGDVIPAEIIFVNTSSQPLILKENPEKSIDLVMHAVDHKTTEDFNYSIGKIKVSGTPDGKFALAVPVKEDFVMEPKSMLSFNSDLNERLYLAPGKYLCYLTNYLVQRSNEISIEIIPTAVSFINLLKIAVDERQSYGKREWAHDWLKKILPEIDIRLSLDTDSVVKKQENSTFNERAYGQYKKWWEENQKSPKFLDHIQKLNP